MGGSSTISTSETKIEALKLQSSAYGVTIPIIGGQTRIPGNLVYYTDFKAIPITTTTSAGKGGGVKTQNTTYQYKASVIMGLCQGPVSDVVRIWKGKQRFEAETITPTVREAEESYTIPPGGGTFTVSRSADFTADISVASDGGGLDDYGLPWYRYLARGVDYKVVGGVYTFLPTVSVTGPVVIRYQYTEPAVTRSAMEQLSVSLSKGQMNQAAPSWVTATHPTEALGYRGLALIHAQDYDLGTGAQVENHTFEVVGFGAYGVNSGTPDCDISEFVFSVLTDVRAGARMPASAISQFTEWSNYCRANGLLFSPALTEQMTAAEFVATAAKLTNTMPVWDVDRLKMVPYGDEAASANGATYTPNVTPVYDLTTDHFLAKAGEDPVQIVRKEQAEAYNHVRVEFQNRANYYNTEIAEAKDDASIEANGLRTMPTIKAPWICDALVARRVAQLLLQRSVNVLATYSFALPWAFDLLQVGDIVTLTEPTQGLEQYAVRITVVEENENGRLSFEAEDFPVGIASDALYPYQQAGGYNHDYNVSPGNVDAPAIFEAPAALTTTGLEVWAAVRGAGSYWGGCNVWASLDGTNYRKVGRVSGGARYGTLTGAISGGNLPVSVSGQLLNASASDSAALQSLCYIGGAQPEYLAYASATLTGPGAYTLGGLTRAGYMTQASAHANGDTFVRVDDAIVKSGALDLGMIGKTIYFKFTSFNVFGAAEQSLADVTAYPYLITGYMAKLPPSQPTGLTAVNEKAGMRLTINKNVEADVVAYSWRVGASWAAGAVLDDNGGTSYLYAMQSVGSSTIWVAAIDAFGNASAPASIVVTVSAPTIVSANALLAGPDMRIDYAANAGTFAIDGYEVRYGDTYAGSTLVGVFKTTNYTRRVDWVGNRRWWITGIDLKGNYGTPYSVDVNVSAPGAVVGARAEIIDNNVLLYWSAPSVGSLPVDRYEVRKGVSFEAGTVVGSNGNSTFAAVFEQQGGLYTYWIAAVDSSGNVGTPVNIAANVNQPPDYVLRTDWNSALGGTRTNLHPEGGALVGPVSTTETIAQHFTTRGWASPQDQISAGYPLFIQPSVTSASYVETFDYGTVLGATVITVTPGFTVIAGTVNLSVQIEYSANGTAWTAATAGATSVLATNFRYVRVTLSLSCTAGANTAKITSLNVKLANKIKTDSGLFTITNATTGVFVPFTIAFVDADTPIAQPNGATPLIPVVDFTDTPNPTGFTVYLYNTSGVKVTGSGSWTARGY